MALQPNITFNRSTSGLGRQADSQDGLAGHVYYLASLPSGFSTSDRIKKIYQISDLESLGVKGDYSNETVATGGNYAMSVTSAANGDTVEFKVTALGVTISLGVATFATSDTTSALATKARTAINALTSTHGFVAGGSGANVLLTAPAGYGANLNASGLTAVVTGTITAPTITQFSGGANDPFIHIHYHTTRHFAENRGSYFYLGLFATSGTLDFAELQTMQTFANGAIKGFFVYSNTTSTAFASSQCTLLQTQINTLTTAKYPATVCYTPNIHGTALSALPDLSSLTAIGVLVDIGQDGDNVGAELYAYLGKSIGSLGALSGVFSKAKVHHNFGWVGQYNIGDKDLEFNVPAFSNGSLWRDNSSSSLPDSLYSYKYTFIKTHINTVAGAWFVDSKTAVADTNDFNTIENNRVYNKQLRLLDGAYKPFLNSPIYVDAETGKIDIATITALENVGQDILDAMERDGEISGSELLIDPDQDVLSTSTIAISVRNVPTGVARYFNFNLGYVTKI